MTDKYLIETDSFPFEFLSQLAERESYRKEVFRPIYYLHKWWAKRLGSVFRGIILGSVLTEGSDLKSEFYKSHSYFASVFDPFMGSGVTIGEAHKLGFTTLGRDINPVAYETVRVSLGALNKSKLENEFEKLSQTVGKKILDLYRSQDSQSNPVDTLYYFWVMQTKCPTCSSKVDLFPSWIIARNAYPDKKPEIQILCPSCQTIFRDLNSQETVRCPKCNYIFSPTNGVADRSNATCSNCGNKFSIKKSLEVSQSPPSFRLYCKLILNSNGEKEYLSTTRFDEKKYEESSIELKKEVESGNLHLPTLCLESGCNTQQAMNYGFKCWRDFFNDRQLLALGLLQNSIITTVEDDSVRDALHLLFSGTLEFNNLFASYKGEGTGAVRHMFSHHILKPERSPIEANIWGTPKSSGSFSTLFQRRLIKAISYREEPTEIDINSNKRKVCSPPFSGKVEVIWPTKIPFERRAIYLSNGDSSKSELPGNSVDLVVTDPPFFDNVNYSELADFFYAWQQLNNKRSEQSRSTRDIDEVQDSDSYKFATKLQSVLTECNRVLKDKGLMVLTYHHSRHEGWQALANALINSGFIPVNAHPVKSEMSVAMPKSQAKEPIQLDTIVVCRKSEEIYEIRKDEKFVIENTKLKLRRLSDIGLKLSENDCKVVFYGELLTTINCRSNLDELPQFYVDDFNDF
jgi:putative DNA methylase